MAILRHRHRQTVGITFAAAAAAIASTQIHAARRAADLGGSRGRYSDAARDTPISSKPRFDKPGRKKSDGDNMGVS